MSTGAFFRVEQISDGTTGGSIDVQERYSGARVSFSVSGRKLGAAKIIAGAPSDEILTAMSSYVWRIAMDRRLID